MRTGLKISSLTVVAVLCLGGLSYADSSSHRQRKAKKPEQPTIPSGPQGPVQQVPLDSIPAVAPHVSYSDGQLTIVAPNSTLGDILRAVHKQTAAEMDIPATATERVVTNLGPGPARSVMAELLNGSKFNYVLLGSPSDTSALTRVVLVAKTGGETPPPMGQQQQVVNQVGNMAPPPPEEAVNDAPDAEATEENTDDAAAEQAAAEAEQPAVIQDQMQQGVRTPQQMLQEMQQRQLQMQQQVAPGQPPIPGGAIPQRLPQQQDPPQQ